MSGIYMSALALRQNYISTQNSIQEEALKVQKLTDKFYSDIENFDRRYSSTKAFFRGDTKELPRMLRVGALEGYEALQSTINKHSLRIELNNQKILFNRKKILLKQMIGGV